MGGRLGVAVFDDNTGEQLGYRADGRFAMASTFKWLLVAAVLHRVDEGALSLVDSISYGPDDLLSYAPISRAHLKSEGGALREAGTLSVGALCAAAVTLSDNTAANLLLQQIDGPAGLTRFARTLGDAETRLDRVEPFLNENRPGDTRDTTTPAAMAHALRAVLLGDVLSPDSRVRLHRWMLTNTTGDAKLRAGLGLTWTVGDKTGSGERGASNDVAIAWPPGGEAPVLIAAYYSGAENASTEERSAVIAEVGRIVREALE